MGNWNFADIWELVADEQPDTPCLIHGDERRTWGEVDRRADGIAQHLLDAGLERQQAVAQYLYNRPGVHRVDVRRVQGVRSSR